MNRSCCIQDRAMLYRKTVEAITGDDVTKTLLDSELARSVRLSIASFSGLLEQC